MLAVTATTATAMLSRLCLEPPWATKPLTIMTEVNIQRPMGAKIAISNQYVWDLKPQIKDSYFLVYIQLVCKVIYYMQLVICCLKQLCYCLAEESHCRRPSS